MKPGRPRAKDPIYLGDNRREGRSKVKPIKMLGLAALAALMAMAFVGASSAMAESTALCKEDAVLLEGEVCPEANRVHHVHEATLTGAPGLLLSSIVEILCDVLFLGDVQNTNNTGNPLQVLGNFTYSNCMTASNGSCTVTEVSSDIKLDILKLGHELADVTPSAGTKGGEVKAQCGFLINCVYDGEGLSGHALGPLLSGTETNGQTRIEEQTTHRVSGVCPETAKLDLLTTPLEATSIAHGMVCVVRTNGLFGTNGSGNGACGEQKAGLTGAWELIPKLAGTP
jgi:hypothetical protein